MFGPTFEYGSSLLCLCGCGEIRRPNVARSYTHFAPEAYLPFHFYHIASNIRSFQVMSLQEKSDEEISDLLDQYGVRHGPIVGSTRALYERKLEDAMENAPKQPSSDKTYYREEEEEVTYITYSPVRHDPYRDLLKRRGNTQENEIEGPEQDTEPPVQASKTSANHSPVPSKEPVKKSGGCLWKLMRLLLILAVIAAVSYYVYCRVVNNDDNPFGIQ